MNIYITGRGNSGTTFMTNLIGNLGFDLGNSLSRQGSPNGAEHTPLLWCARKINQERAIGREKSFPFVNYFDSGYHEYAVERYHIMIETHGELPECAKAPEEGQAAILDLLDPDHTIVMIREPSKWVDSVENMNKGLPASGSNPRYIKENGMFLDLGRLFYYLAKYDLDFTAVEYPRAAQDPVYTWDKIYPVIREFKDVCFTEYFEAWKDTVNEEWIR